MAYGRGDGGTTVPLPPLPLGVKPFFSRKMRGKVDTAQGPTLFPLCVRNGRRRLFLGQQVQATHCERREALKGIKKKRRKSRSKKVGFSLSPLPSSFWLLSLSFSPPQSSTFFVRRQ